MAIAFRAKSDNGNASGGALTVTLPTGTLDGDLIVVHGYLETDTNTWSSVGAGFTSVTSGTNTGAFLIQAWWKIASSEPASWTWTPTTTGVWRSVNAASYSGFSGSSVDIAGTTGQADAVIATSQTAPSITTITDGSLVLFCYGNFGGTAPASIGGFCTNLRTGTGGTTIGDAIKTPTGATGTSWGVGAGSQDYAAFHYAMTPTSGAAAAFPLPHRRASHPRLLPQ